MPRHSRRSRRKRGVSKRKRSRNCRYRSIETTEEQEEGANVITRDEMMEMSDVSSLTMAPVITESVMTKVAIQVPYQIVRKTPDHIVDVWIGKTSVQPTLYFGKLDDSNKPVKFHSYYHKGLYSFKPTKEGKMKIIGPPTWNKKEPIHVWTDIKELPPVYSELGFITER